MFLERQELIEKMLLMLKINKNVTSQQDFIQNLTNDAIQHLGFNSWIMNDKQYEEYYRNNFPKICEAYLTNFDQRTSWKINDTRKQKPSLIREIENINFVNLTILSLANNGIVSIECLSNIYAPKIESLYLNNNYITNIRPLARSNFPKLTILSIYLNYFNQLDDMTIADFGSLYQFSLDHKHDLYYYHPRNRVQCNTLHFLVKMFAPKISFISYNIFDRVDNYQLDDKLYDKFDNLLRQRLLS